MNKGWVLLLGLLILLLPVWALAQDDDDYGEDDEYDYYDSSYDDSTACDTLAANSFFSADAYGSNVTLAMVDSLLNLKADVNEHDMFNRSVLQVALYYGWPQECVERLIAAGADLKEKDVEGADMILIAAFGSRWETVQYLAEKQGFSLRSEDTNQRDLAMYAAYGNNLEVLKALTGPGTNYVLERVDAYGNTLLLYALMDMDVAPEVIDYILSLKPDLKHVNADGANALGVACQNDVPLAVIKALILAGVAINQTDNNGMTPFLYAAGMTSDADVLLYLLDLGANGSIRTPDGESAYDLILKNNVLMNDHSLDDPFVKRVKKACTEK